MGLFRKPFIEMPLGCFGKLPSYADFVRLDLDSKLSQFLREWLTSAAPEGFGPETLSCGTRFFLNGGRKALAGVVVGSEDSHGRRFPFSAFVEVPVDQVGKTLSSALYAIETCWRQLESILRSLSPIPENPPIAPMASLAELYGAIRTGKVRVQRDAMDTCRVETLLDNVEVETYDQMVGESSPADLSAAVQLIQSHFRSRSPRDLHGEAFRVPYVFGQGYLVQAAFWLGLLRGRAKDLPLVPTWFSPIEPGLGNRGLWMCFREMNALDARVVLGMDETHDHVLDLTRAVEDDHEPFTNRWPEGIRTLEQLLRYLNSRA